MARAARPYHLDLFDSRRVSLSFPLQDDEEEKNNGEDKNDEMSEENSKDK